MTVQGHGTAAFLWTLETISCVVGGEHLEAVGFALWAGFWSLVEAGFCYKAAGILPQFVS